MNSIARGLGTAAVRVTVAHDSLVEQVIFNALEVLNGKLLLG
jgi:hypothetical protein